MKTLLILFALLASFNYFSLNAQISDEIDRLIATITSENINIKERLDAIETLKKNPIKLDEKQKTKLLNAILTLPLDLSTPLAQWLIDSENINNYTLFKENLFSVIIQALENKIDSPDEVLFLLNSFLDVLEQNKQTLDYTEKEQNYLLSIGEALYKYIDNDKSDQLLKIILLRPSLKNDELDFLNKEEVEIWDILTPNVSNLILVIRHQTDEKRRKYTRLLLSKAKDMSDLNSTLTLLSIFRNNLDFLLLFQKEEIEILFELLSNKDSAVVELSKDLLSQILHVDKTLVAEWWRKKRDSFDFDSHLKKIIINPGIELETRSFAISQLCILSSDSKKFSENIDFLFNIAKDKSAGDIRGSAAFAIRDNISNEKLLELIRDFLSEKYWQRMGMHIITNTKCKLRDNSIEQKIKQILLDSKEEERTKIYYALPALIKLTNNKKTTAIFIIDLVEQDLMFKDNKSSNTLQTPVYNALQSMIGKSVNNDLILLRKAVSEMPDDPPEEADAEEKESTR